MIEIKRETAQPVVSFRPATFTITVSNLEDFMALFSAVELGYMAADGSQSEEWRLAESTAFALLSSLKEEAIHQAIAL